MKYGFAICAVSFLDQVLNMMRGKWWLTYGFLMPMASITLGVLWFCVVKFKLARRRGTRSLERPPINNDFSLGELDQLCREGKISVEECEKAKKSVIAKDRARMEVFNSRSTGGFPVISTEPPPPPEQKQN